MYVPYISSLLASLGEGEFHHPRIKVVAPGDTMAPGVDSVNTWIPNTGEQISYLATAMPELYCQEKVTLKQINIF
jgi:hypothetical protein